MIEVKSCKVIETRALITPITIHYVEDGQEFVRTTSAEEVVELFKKAAQKSHPMEKVIANLNKTEVIVAANFAHDHPDVAMEVRSLVQEALQELSFLTQPPGEPKPDERPKPTKPGYELRY